MKFIKKLREEDPSSVVAYHLEGMLEAQESIRAFIVKLSEDSAPDPESTAETLAYLQVEIYDHLVYHMKELRRPFKRLVEAAFKDLPDISEDEGVELLQRLPEGDKT